MSDRLDKEMDRKYLNLGNVIIMRLYSKIGKEHYLFFNQGDITHPILLIEKSDMNEFKEWIENK